MFTKINAEVVKRGPHYLVIARKEIRLFGRVLWSGEWKQFPQKFMGRNAAREFGLKVEEKYNA